MRNVKKYFDYRGERYWSKSIIKVRVKNNITNEICEKNGEFCYVLDDNKYVININGDSLILSMEEFYCMLVDVVCNGNTIPNIENMPEKKTLTFKDELSIDGLLLAWIWYVFIMAVAVIFKDCIGIWVLTSMIFFNYRNKKLKEAGYK